SYLLVVSAPLSALPPLLTPFPYTTLFRSRRRCVAALRLALAYRPFQKPIGSYRLHRLRVHRQPKPARRIRESDVPLALIRHVQYHFRVRFLTDITAE